MANGHEEFPGQHDALYQDAAENLRFVKAQQWRVTNYALLVMPPLTFCAEMLP